MTREEINFINNYVLTDEDYSPYWSAVQDEIFLVSKDAHKPIWLPEHVFSTKYYYNVFLPGGFHLNEGYLESLKSFLKSLGEDKFVMIENEWIKCNYKGPKYIFPASISWEEYNRGGDFIEPLVISFDRDYYIFGKTHRWGVYSSAGLNLIVAGFECVSTANTFKELFNVNEDTVHDLENILDHLKESEPSIYDRLLDNYSQLK